MNRPWLPQIFHGEMFLRRVEVGSGSSRWNSGCCKTKILSKQPVSKPLWPHYCSRLTDGPVENAIEVREMVAHIEIETLRIARMKVYASNIVAQS